MAKNPTAADLIKILKSDLEKANKDLQSSKDNELKSAINYEKQLKDKETLINLQGTEITILRATVADYACARQGYKKLN